MIQDDKRRAEAPELTTQQYIAQLADRGEVAKLTSLKQATYYQITMIVNQQNVMQLQQMAQMQQQQVNGGEGAQTENGHAQQQPGGSQQFYGGMPMNGGQ